MPAGADIQKRYIHISYWKMDLPMQPQSEDKNNCVREKTMEQKRKSINGSQHLMQPKYMLKKVLQIKRQMNYSIKNVRKRSQLLW